MERRSFLARAGRGALGLSLAGGALVGARAARAQSAPPLAVPEGVAPMALAADEAFWAEVARDWAPAPDYLNLEYGFFHPAPLSVLEVQLRDARRINSRASHYKREEQAAAVDAARTDLAALAGAATGEIGMFRNITEALNIVIQGLDLAAGDEIIHGDQDYGSMLEAMKQKVARQGVVLKEVKVPLHPPSDDALIRAYVDAIGPRTKLLHVTQLVNISGQILPVRVLRAIADAAHAKGAEVVVDGAHAFGQLPFQIPELGCDYYGSSLHKWLCAPLGCGLLYVKQDKVEKLWPLNGDMARKRDDIRKLERLGTREDSVYPGLQAAIRFHRTLGAENKFARLQYLQRRWVEPLRSNPRVILNTPADPARHGAIGSIGLVGVTPADLGKFWRERHGIYTAPVNHSVVKGVRVTPGLPTPVRHIDAFRAAIDDALQHFA